MPLQGLLREDLQFVLFGGKGGVGKTTCACATGLYMAQLGRRTLVCSTDPAHSLSGIFEQRVGDNIAQVDGVEGLFALEVSAEKALRELKEQYKGEIDEALGQLLVGFDMPFEREIARDLASLTPPGIDELMALSKLKDILRDQEYDLVVVDTAAGAHTIRLLELPRLAEEFFDLALKIQGELRHVAPLERARLLMEDVRKGIATLRAHLTDAGRTAFVLVTIPEVMGILVTEDMIRGLRSCGVPYRTIVVNFTIPPYVSCGYCLQRREGQAKCIGEIRDRFPECEVHEVAAFPREIRGLDALAGFAGALFEGRYEPKFCGIPGEPPTKALGTPRLDVAKQGLQLMIFGGKGGCGKTTSSAAAGVYMARRGRRALVVSTDPQRSLSDSFDQALGHVIMPIEGVPGLYGLELDTEKLTGEFKERHSEEIVEIFTAATLLKKEDVAQLLGLSLPGMDEFMALVELIKIMKRGEFDLLILDTAPTGHTLRLLELPSLVSDWLRVMVKMRSKTQYMVQRFFGRPVRERADIFLEGMMDDVRRVKAALTNPLRTEFIAVTTLEEMAIRETERLVSTLASHRMPLRQIIINGLVPPNPGCEYCSSKGVEQLRAFEEVRQRLPGLKMVVIHLFPHEVRGLKDLQRFATALFEGR